MTSDTPGNYLLPVDESAPPERLRWSMLLVVGAVVVLIHLALVTVFTPLAPDTIGRVAGTDHSTAYISFYSVGANLCALTGMVLGTWIVSLRADVPFIWLGFEVYMVQFTCLIRFVTMAVMGLMCYFGWRKFTSEDEIRLVES